MQSSAKTVAEYLDELPEDRRAVIEAVRHTILANIDSDIEEGMQYGMIGYYIPHRVFPAGYHCDPRQPLPYVSLASQKRHMAVYLMTTYMAGEEEQWLRAAWEKTGRKLDMGRCCIRFRKLEDVPLAVLGEAIRRVSGQAHIAHYAAALAMPRVKGKPVKKAAKKAAKKTTKTAAKKTVRAKKPG